MGQGSNDGRPGDLGSAVDWASAAMEQGFDGLSRLSSNAEDVSAARTRYDDLRTDLAPVVRGADRIELVMAADRIERSGRQDQALVIVTESMVIVSGVHRGFMGIRTVMDIFPRSVLTVLPPTDRQRHAVELHADGRRLRLLLPNAMLQAALIALSGRDAR